jgi:hypothetical protein
MSFIMKRRTMADSILGRPLVYLPEPHQIDITIDFAPEEKALYGLLEEKFREDVNQYVSPSLSLSHVHHGLQQLQMVEGRLR